MDDCSPLVEISKFGYVSFAYLFGFDEVERILNVLISTQVDGYAPTQLRDLRRAPNMRPKSAAASTPGHRSRVLAPVAANANANAARPPRAATATATATATSARAVYAQENAPRKQPPRRQYTPKRADRASSPDFGSSPRTPGGSRPKSAPAARRKPPPMARA